MHKVFLTGLAAIASLLTLSIAPSVQAQTRCWRQGNQAVCKENSNNYNRLNNNNRRTNNLRNNNNYRYNNNWNNNWNDQSGWYNQAGRFDGSWSNSNSNSRYQYYANPWDSPRNRSWNGTRDAWESDRNWNYGYRN